MTYSYSCDVDDHQLDINQLMHLAVVVKQRFNQAAKKKERVPMGDFGAAEATATTLTKAILLQELRGTFTLR